MSEHEAAHSIPSNFDLDGLQRSFSNPVQAFRMLDKNGDGRITHEDLEALLKQCGIPGMGAKVLAKYIFKELDANGNGTIDASDLMHANGILARLMKLKQNSGQ